MAVNEASNNLTLEQIADLSLKPEVFLYTMNKLRQQSKTMYFSQEKPFIKVRGAIVDGRKFSINERNELRELYYQMFPAYQMVSIPEGTVLYRSIRPEELRQICEDGVYLIRSETNFEDNIGPQVSQYLQDPEYAGVLIRLKTNGPFYKPAGTNPPRITSMVPHYAVVEISSDAGNNWENIENYKAKQNK